MVKLTELIAPAFYEVHRDIEKDRFTHYFFAGGRGSGKSSFISLEIILGMMKDENANAVALRKIGANIRDSVFEQLVWAIEMLGVENEWEEKAAPPRLFLKKTGQKIVFKGCDEPKKIRSIKFRKGYAKYIWYEEADEFVGMEEIRTINQSLMRGGEKFNVFYSFNPPREKRHWINCEILKERNDTKLYKSVYTDMPERWLGDVFLKEAEYLKKTHPREYEHEYMGVAVGGGGEIFENVVIRKIDDSEVDEFDKISRGLDWGYASDPLHYCVNNYDRQRKKLFIFYEVHKSGVTNEKAAKLILEENTDNGIVICDSAEPKSIAELCYWGVNAVGAKKGAGSVEYGIKWLRNLDEIIIDPERCPNTAREFLEYAFEEDGNGGYKAYYPDKNNHSIDAVRYSRQYDMEMVKVR